jgi:hypothetical protein
MSHRRFRVIWLAGYLATIGTILLGLRLARQSVIAEAGSPEAIAAWRDWAAETRKAPEPGEPVQRRAVKSDEPPLLILMRDHFLVIEIVSLAIGSFLFAFLGFLMTGIMRQPHEKGPRSGGPAV